MEYLDSERASVLSEKLPMVKFTDPVSKLGGCNGVTTLETTGLSLPFRGSEGGAGLSEILREFAL